MITITENQINRVNQILAGVPGGAERALSSAINRALGTLKTQSGRMIRDTYHIKRSNVAGNIGINKASTSSLVGEIAFSGTMIPLIQFKVGKGNGVTAAVLKENSGTRLESAYIANLGYGTGIFERETSKRESSRQLFGPSVPHMMENANVLVEVDKIADEVIVKRVEHEIDRILNGL